MVLFFKIMFYISFDGSSHQRCKFKILIKIGQTVWMQQVNFVYCSCLNLTVRKFHYGYHNFQMLHFSAVKFYRGYEKNMSFLVMLKSPNLEKNVEKIGLGTRGPVLLSVGTLQWRKFPFWQTQNSFYWFQKENPPPKKKKISLSCNCYATWAL